MTTKVHTFAEYASDCSAQEYREYLLGQISWAEQVLSLPVMQWTTGSSHDVAREILNLAKEYEFDLILSHGCFNANGALVAFQ
jgi:selenocysteine lyase/cysteine desulfurase